MSDEVRMGPGREFDAIRAMLARWGDRARGIGDDAAVLEIARGERLVVSVDSFVAGRHFRDGWLEPREIGYKAVTAALSDLAAMAARPIGILVALALPDAWRDRLDALADGIADAAQCVHAPIVGGNTSAAGELSVVTTVLGQAFEPLRRSGARPGDAVYVTGTLGGAGAALRALSRGEAPTPPHRARFARPVARIAAARWLANAGATACIDVSDGLAADAAHLAAASAVEIAVELSALPLVAGVTPREGAASGEEYELVVTAPGGLDTAAFERALGLALTRIGEVRGPSDVGALVLELEGKRVAPVSGHDHLSS